MARYVPAAALFAALAALIAGCVEAGDDGDAISPDAATEIAPDSASPDPGPGDVAHADEGGADVSAAEDVGGTEDPTGTEDVTGIPDPLDLPHPDAQDATEASETLDPKCPATAPIGAPPTCEAGLHCEYGQECCCGKCHPSLVCECHGGAGGGGGWGCYYTDACMIPGCPDEPPPEGSCRTHADCTDAASCLPPGEPMACGICNHPETGWPQACVKDGDCDAGTVCEWTEPPVMCLCEAAFVCVPACGAETACGMAEHCEAGHCKPDTCEVDGDCPPLFECPLVGRRGPTPCMRRGCQHDLDCGQPDAHCVAGLCHDAFGTCRLPVP
ncbi:MAG: hypothetical protein FJ087_09270 [Deltaproteobacteria bacterium]|nr:hypothetical protein [Deltaproteobacteria bacterium]